MDMAAARDLLHRLEGMTAFAHMRQREPVRSLYQLLAISVAEEQDPSDFVARYGAVYEAFLQCAAEGYDGFSGALLMQVAYSPCPFATLAARIPFSELPYSMVRAGTQDLAALGELADLEPAHVLELAARQGIPKERTGPLPAWESSLRGAARDARLSAKMLSAEGLEALCDFFRVQGSGLFARYAGLCYVGESPQTPLGLVGVDTPDPIALEDLVRYEKQRRVLVENTEYLLAGQQCANILLYGDKGTGKSASVKALLNAYSKRGLRIVEVPPAQLTHLPRLFALLREQPCKSIVFVDDLAFSDSCPEYTALKTVLEGGLEARPRNVAVYATSNRMNIVRQRFSERADDVNERDTLEEKFSLADRFDLRLTFQAPTQQEYLAIVEELLHKAGLGDISQDGVRETALQWSVRRASTSPRTARQFVDARIRERSQ